MDNSSNDKSTSAAASYIEITDVSHRYPGSDALALEGVSLSIPAGKVFGVLGPNGAGKSTLLSIMSGILPLQQGNISIDSNQLKNRLHLIKEFSAIVPQEYAFYAALTVRENLQFFASLVSRSKQDRLDRVNEVIDSCQLGEVINKLAGDCSGGLKRRLNLAIGLLGRPKLLYLDEPTVGIDTQSRRFILEQIKNFSDAGMSIIYTSHYFEEVQVLCDEVAVIDSGKLIYQQLVNHQDGSAKDLEERYIKLIKESHQ